MAALDSKSSAMSTKVFRERLRKQLIGKIMKDDEESILLLITFVNKRQTLAQIKDYTFVGLQASEAISKEIAQASQDSFKVSAKKATIGSLVESLKSITSTVKDRKDQKITVHLDQAYCPFGNFTLSDVVAMRSVFVETTIKQLLVHEPTIGIIDEFEGGKVNTRVRKLRNTAKVRYNTNNIAHGNWNSLVLGTQRGLAFSRAILIMRFQFDKDLMYARNLNMLNIIKLFEHVMNGPGKDYGMAICASSFGDGVIDVCVNVQEDPLSTIFQSELVVLDGVIKDILLETHTSGIHKVTDMYVEQVDMLKLFKVTRPHPYTIAELGKEQWIDDNGLDKFDSDEIESYIKVVPKEHIEEDGYIPVIDIDDNMFCVFLSNGLLSDEEEAYEDPSDGVLTKAFVSYYMRTLDSDKGIIEWLEDNKLDSSKVQGSIRVVLFEDLAKLDGHVVIGRIYEWGEEFCVYLPEDVLNTTDFRVPTKQELNNAYANYHLYKNEVENSLDNMWVIELNIIKMKRLCIDYETQIARILEYSGIVPVSVVNHELVKLPYYVYVMTEEDPETILSDHFGVDNKMTYTDMSYMTHSIVQEYADSIDQREDMNENPEEFYSAHRDIIVKRLTKYVYAVLEAKPKGISKSEKFYMYFDTLPYEQHVLYHAYSEVIRIPFVDRLKTTSNDWYTSTYTLGADCARNIYADEFYQLASASSDARHIELFCDIVFEKGYPAGSGQHSGEAHGIGTTTMMSSAKQKSQLTTAWNKGAESVKRVDVAVFFGTPHIQEGTKSRQVRANERKTREFKERVDKTTMKYDISITGKTLRTDTYTETESVLDRHVRALYIGVDPFNIAIDIQASRVFENKADVLEDDDIVPTYYMSADSEILGKIRDGMTTWITDLKRYKSYKESTPKTISMSITSGVLNIAPLYEFLALHKAVEFFLP